MPVIPFGNATPVVAQDAWVAPDAWVTGDTTIESLGVILFGASLRGDIEPIHVGAGSNVQDGAVLHTSHNWQPCIVGQNVTIGHHAIVHGATVGDGALVGMNATILDGATLGAGSILGANSLLPSNKKIPEGVLAVGSPAKVVRELSDEEREGILKNALHYQAVAKEYRKTLGPGH